MRRLSLGAQVFLSILAVALGAVLTVGLVARNALSSAFDAYLATLPNPNGAGMAGRPHYGRMMLGAAEQTFVATVDRSVYIGAITAVVIAIVVALLLARHLSRPIRNLEDAAEDLASGDLTRRVNASGPIEVAALGDAFNRMADSMERAETLRKRLVADVAHELRNPIAAARIQAEGMAEGMLDPDQARLDMLVHDINHLSVLVDELQELAIAEAGGLNYEMVSLDLAGLVARETARTAATSPDAITVETSGIDEPVAVTGDEVRLSEVLRNLLSNAVRHTCGGTVRVELAVLEDGRREVRVSDSGEGIPEADLPFVFERFYRADAARASDTGGAGLGLAIVRRIVEDHGGEVFAETSPLGGAVVGFRLPAGG